MPLKRRRVGRRVSEWCLWVLCIPRIFEEHAAHPFLMLFPDGVAGRGLEPRGERRGYNLDGPPAQLRAQHPKTKGQFEATGSPAPKMHVFGLQEETGLLCGEVTV